jgi:hypothetical protein
MEQIEKASTVNNSDKNCRCGQPVRKPGQRSCAFCHAAAQRRYRQRKKAAAKKLLEHQARLVFIRDAQTEQNFLKLRPEHFRVIYYPPGDEPRLSGLLNGFLPGNQLLILTLDGQNIIVPLKNVQLDL